MHAIHVKICSEERSEINAFIREINEEESIAAYAIDNTKMIVATSNECAMAYIKARLEVSFTVPIIETIK